MKALTWDLVLSIQDPESGQMAHRSVYDSEQARDRALDLLLKQADADPHAYVMRPDSLGAGLIIHRESGWVVHYRTENPPKTHCIDGHQYVVMPTGNLYRIGPAPNGQPETGIAYIPSASVN